MMYCKNCGVTVKGDKSRCPLCKHELTGTPDITEEVFPRIEDKKYDKNMFLKIVSFVSIIAIVCSTGLNIIIPMKNHVWWSFFSSAGVVCVWLSIATAIMKRRNILKNINWQLFWVTIFAVLWDEYTGWHGWSLDYVFPFSCVASMACMFVLSKILKIQPRGFALYMLFDIFYGIIPAFFMAMGWLNVVYPTVCCVAVSIISVSGILIFEGRNIREDIVRKLHM